MPLQRPTDGTFGPVFAQVLVDVGRFDSEEDAARAYDRAAVWCLGLTAQTNFPVSDLIQVGHTARTGRGWKGDIKKLLQPT